LVEDSITGHLGLALCTFNFNCVIIFPYSNLFVFWFEIFIVIRETQLANRKAKASERSPLTLPPLYCRVAVKRQVLPAAGESQGRSMPIWRLAESTALCAAAAMPPPRHQQQPRGHCTLMNFQQLLFGFLILVLANPFLKTLCSTVGCSEIFGGH
jgi:hypothetical protein